MTKQALVRALKERNERHPIPPCCLIGFDGFVDEIAWCVRERLSATHFTRLEHVGEFAKRVGSAAGKSTNIELVPQGKKIGGNAPILASALISLGCRTSLVAALGRPNIYPLFQPLVQACDEVFTISEPGHTDALEFVDGKILLGKLGSITEISPDTLLAHVGKEALIRLLHAADLVATVNWTMIPAMTAIWEFLLQDIFPHVPHNKQRWLFVDLADPAKRSDGELRSALHMLGRLRSFCTVCLGLNEKEAERIGALSGNMPLHTSLDVRARLLRSFCAIDELVIHTATAAAAADTHAAYEVAAPFTPRPHLSTGGGDTFNAGYSWARLCGFDLEGALLLGCATSGYYVRQGVSPSIGALAQFIATWAENPDALESAPWHRVSA